MPLQSHLKSYPHRAHFLFCRCPTLNSMSFFKNWLKHIKVEIEVDRWLIHLKFGSTTKKGKRNIDVYKQRHSVTCRLISEYSKTKQCYNHKRNKNVKQNQLKPMTTHFHNFATARRMLGGEFTKSKSPSWNVAWGCPCEKHQAEWSSQIEKFWQWLTPPAQLNLSLSFFLSPYWRYGSDHHQCLRLPL